MRLLTDGAAWEEPSNVRIAKVSNQLNKQRLGAKAAKQAERLGESVEYLNDSESTTYRALAARANYLAMDRPDIGHSTKELCRHFASPTRDSVESLKILVRFLVGRPRLIWFFGFQADEKTLDVFVDTDFGGCHTTRRSTSGGAMMHGAHLINIGLLLNPL